MKLPLPLVEGTLIRRRNRFLADIRLHNGEQVVAHCPNTGSMLGCNIQGSRVLLSTSSNPKRRTTFTWEMIEVQGGWVGINTHRTNGLVKEAIQAGLIRELRDYDQIKTEVAVGSASRLDLLLEGLKGRCYIEVKNVTLVKNRVALFPDAVTLRGQKHLTELEELAAQGHRAVIFFAVQREDARTFAPADDIDPAYGHGLRSVVNRGVEAIAYIASVAPGEVYLKKRLPVRL